MRGFFAGACAVMLMMGFNTAADAAGCSFVSSAMEGVVQSVGGDVMRSGARGFTEAASGDVLHIGSQLITGAKSSASVEFDGKVLKVGPNSTVNVSRNDGHGVCLRVARAGAGAGSSGGGSAAGGSLSGALGGNGMALGAGLIGLGGIGAIVAVAVSGHGASN